MTEGSRTEAARPPLLPRSPPTNPALRRMPWSGGSTTHHLADDHHLLVLTVPRLSTTILVDGRRRPCRLRAEDSRVTLVPSGGAAMFFVEAGEGEDVVLSLSPSSILLSCGVADPPTWRAGDLRRDRRVADGISSLADLDAACTAALDLLCRSVTRRAAHIFAGISRRADDAWLPSAALVRTAQAVQMADGAPIRIRDLASEAGLSPSAFSRAFRGSTGITPGEFIIHHRFETARMLLARTGLPIADVTRRSGLRSVPHFTTQFSNRFGCSPARYRRLERGSEHVDRADVPAITSARP